MVSSYQVLPIEKFYGKYVGVSPTDESPIAFGEMELILNKERVKIRMASGLEIITEEMPSIFAPMTEEELRSHFKEDAREESVSGTYGFHLEDGLDYLFTVEPKDRVGLIMRGGMGDLLGPTVLTKSPSAIRYKLMMAPLVAQGMPMLRYGGHSPSRLQKWRFMFSK